MQQRQVLAALVLLFSAVAGLFLSVDPLVPGTLTGWALFAVSCAGAALLRLRAVKVAA